MGQALEGRLPRGEAGDYDGLDVLPVGLAGLGLGVVVGLRVGGGGGGLGRLGFRFGVGTGAPHQYIIICNEAVLR